MSIEVEAQSVPQKTTKTSASRVKQRQQEGTEPHKRTVRERKRGVQRTPEERPSHRDLGAPSPATIPTILKGVPRNQPPSDGSKWTAQSTEEGEGGWERCGGIRMREVNVLGVLRT